MNRNDNDAIDLSEDKSEEESVEEINIKRKRGRPRKTDKPEETKEEALSKKKKHGRPIVKSNNDKEKGPIIKKNVRHDPRLGNKYTYNLNNFFILLNRELDIQTPCFRTAFIQPYQVTEHFCFQLFIVKNDWDRGYEISLRDELNFIERLKTTIIEWNNDMTKELNNDLNKT